MARIDDPRIAVAAAPLPADTPDPAEFRYDPVFDKLQAELRLADKQGPGAVDWPGVARQSVAILERYSKDLLVAAWFAAAAARSEGLRGLATGLAVVNDLAQTQWAQLYPPPARERARMQALDWLADQASRTLPAELPERLGESDAAAVISASTDAAEIERVFNANFTKERVSLGPLLRGLRPLLDVVERAAAAQAASAAAAAPPPPASAAPAPAPAAAPQASAQVTVAPIALPADADADKVIGAVRTTVRDAALGLLRADLRQARAYALLRSVTWLDVTETPPAHAGKTDLMPPPPSRLEEFAAMQVANSLADLVLELESFLSGPGLFWLNGQRIVHTCLLQLGPDYAAGSREVARGVAALLARLPDLAQLAFQDGTPFADPATRDWIAREAAPPARAEAAADDADADADADAEIERASAPARDGRLEDAVRALAAGAAAAASGRARFRWQIALARICLDAGHPRVALPLLRRASARAATVESWEPRAAAEAASLLWRCISQSGSAIGLGEAERATELSNTMDVLSRTDTVAALQAASGLE